MSEVDRWGELVSTYEALAEPLTRPHALAAIDAAGGVGPGTLVLDVGAGTGVLSLLAAQAGATVLATDLSPGMVGRALERLAAFPNCAARVMDGQALDVADGSFEAAFSIFGVMLFPDPSLGLQELARVIRPGGRAVITVWKNTGGGGQFAALSEAFARYSVQEPPRPPENMVALTSPDVLGARMTDAGFGNVVVQTFESDWTGSSIDAMVSEARRITSFNPSFAEIVRTDWYRFSSALRAVLERYRTQDGISVPSPSLLALGHR